MPWFRCIRPCFHEGSFYDLGQEVDWPEDKVASLSFKDSAGKTRSHWEKIPYSPKRERDPNAEIRRLQQIVEHLKRSYATLEAENAVLASQAKRTIPDPQVHKNAEEDEDA